MALFRCFRRVALAVGQGVEGVAALALADLGEVEITHNFLEGAVPEIGGDLADGGSTFKHVGAITVAQGVRSKAVVFFGQTTLGLGDLHGSPCGGLIHGLGAAVNGLAQGNAR